MILLHKYQNFCGGFGIFNSCLMEKRKTWSKVLSPFQFSFRLFFYSSPDNFLCTFLPWFLLFSFLPLVFYFLCVLYRFLKKKKIHFCSNKFSITFRLFKIRAFPSNSNPSTCFHFLQVTWWAGGTVCSVCITVSNFLFSTLKSSFHMIYIIFCWAYYYGFGIYRYSQSTIPYRFMFWAYKIKHTSVYEDREKHLCRSKI